MGKTWVNGQIYPDICETKMHLKGGVLHVHGNKALLSSVGHGRHTGLGQGSDFIYRWFEISFN